MKGLFQRMGRLRWWTMLGLTMAWKTTLSAQTNVEVSGDIHLRGLLGEKLKIEMMLELDHDQPFFNHASKECLDLSGEYYYRTQVLPIRLEGRLCPANATFFLTVNSDGNESERFEGKWDPKAKQLKGTWTLKKTGKTMPFTLTAAEVGVPGATIQGYYALLRDQLTQEPHAEGAKIDDAQWSATTGGKITNFAPNWGGDIDLFAPTRLVFDTRYNSTARSSDYIETYQLLPGSGGVYVAHLFRSYHYEKGPMGDEEVEGTSSCGFEFTVYKISGDQIEDVTTKVLPSDVKLTMEASGGEDLDCGGYLIGDGLRLANGDKLYWDGVKYVR